ncbi:hypothetical protein [Leptospira noguchii]
MWTPTAITYGVRLTSSFREEWILRATGCRVPRKSGSFFLLEEAD